MALLYVRSVFRRDPARGSTSLEASKSESWSCSTLEGGPGATPVEEVIAAFATDSVDGLTRAEAADRLAQWGPNELPHTDPVPGWRQLIGHFADPLVYLLLAAIVVSLIAWVGEGARGAPFDAIVIAVIVVANAAIGYFQEAKAEQAVAALRDLTQTEATVVRDGAPRRVAAAELVPGDVVVLADGDVIPADARVVEASLLRVAEAAVTGESNPVTKTTDPVAPDAPVGDRTGMVHSGTAVVLGRGRAVVTATGSATEVGRIATLLDETEDEPTPLQREITRVGAVLGVAVVIIAVVVVTTLIVVDGVRTGSELVAAALIGVSLAVAAVPEGLPAVLSLVLALGVQRMSQRNALVKGLPAVETLGSATVICSDKTGTLTRNEMMVRRLVVPSGEIELSGSGYDPGGELLHDGVPLPISDSTVGPVGLQRALVDEAQWALVSGGLASDASIGVSDGVYRPIGDPTEAALIAAQPKAGIDRATLGRRFVRTAEIPFTSERKRMSTIQADHERGDQLMMATKGAPDLLIDRCRAERRAGRVVALDEERRQWWLDAVDGLARQALRTLAVAYRPLTNTELEGVVEVDESVEDELILLGVVGIIDPPREEARVAVAAAHQAGIRVVMITGDHPSTAGQIAVELGISSPGDRVFGAADLAGISESDLASMAGQATVYARVDPEQKLRIVQALTSQGEVVAMTGDGVNDAPALKAATIGVAMGITGTDVSKEAADMILTDDNFATIVSAVSEGRAIFHNIRSFLRYLLSSNIGEVLTVFLGVVGAGVIGLADNAGDGLTAPLLAVQILWINLVTDTGPALALGVDPPLSGLMDRRPRRAGERVIDRRMQVGIGVVGLTMALATLAMIDLRLPGGLVEGSGDLATARTAAFTTLVLAQLANTFNARSDTESAWGRLTINRWLLVAIVGSLALQVVVVHLPALNEPFDTVPLGITDWLLAAVLATSVIWVSEVRKWILRRRTDDRDLD
ncbi:MAG: cation-translocating P-type ATPase [Actinomycetia bacterium]|nr:cation-translocating P-type ATPase [Actinomycetes bacterium]